MKASDVETSKVGTEEPLHKQKTHHNATHGSSNDIDEGTPIYKVKGPNVFERAKEEIEAITGICQQVTARERWILGISCKTFCKMLLSFWWKERLAVKALLSNC